MARIEIEQLVNLFRKKFAIPNLIIGIGILFFLGKMLSVWFGPAKEPDIKLADINLTEKSGFFSKRMDISLSDYEVIPKKNLFRSSRTEWVPPAPPPPPKSAPAPPPKPTPPPPPPPKPTPPPEITVSGLLEGGIFTKRAILEGNYFTPKIFEKKVIKRKGYKLYDMIGQYQINKIDNDKVVLVNSKGESYEYFMKKSMIKREEIFNPLNQLKKGNLLGTAVKDWKLPEKSTFHISGATTDMPRYIPDKSQHISGMETTIPRNIPNKSQHISGN